MYADIDECEEGTYNCSQLCVNDPGSYHCECNMTEYVLLSDRRSCESELRSILPSVIGLLISYAANEVHLHMRQRSGLNLG